MAPDKAPRLLFDTFHKITDKHGVVVDNWPLPKFCSPFDVHSRASLDLLYRAWTEKRTRFRRLTSEEAEAWSQARFEEAMAQTTTAMPPTVTASASVPLPGPSSVPISPLAPTEPLEPVLSNVIDPQLLGPSSSGVQLSSSPALPYLFDGSMPPGQLMTMPSSAIAYGALVPQGNTTFALPVPGAGTHWDGQQIMFPQPPASALAAAGTSQHMTTFRVASQQGVPAKTKKPRRDKGIPRGPQKNKRKAAQTPETS